MLLHSRTCYKCICTFMKKQETENILIFLNAYFFYFFIILSHSLHCFRVIWLLLKFYLVKICNSVVFVILLLTSPFNLWFLLIFLELLLLAIFFNILKVFETYFKHFFVLLLKICWGTFSHKNLFSCQANPKFCGKICNNLFIALNF